MKKGLICIFVLVITILVIYRQNYVSENKEMNTEKIDGRIFNGFEQCNINRELSQLADRLIITGKPFKKQQGAWTYPINSQIIGLPVKAIGIGVCDEKGSRACGWGSFLAVVINQPLKQTKYDLKKETGIDFTKENRDQETDETIYPILVSGDNDDECILYCDPGGL